MEITRRYFLKSSGLSLFGLGCVPSFLRRTAFALEGPAAAKKKVLVALFMRGAADGLNIVVPYAENNYYQMRPTIAIPKPGKGDGGEGAIDLNGFFGFHPRLAPLKPIFDAGHLAVIHAAGSPDSTRSHFDAQDYMETATPGNKSTQDGWLNRYLQRNVEVDPTPFRAVALAPALPVSLQGRAPALAFNDIRQFHLAMNPKNPAYPLVEGAFQSLYASTSDPLLSRTARETFEATKTLEGIQAQQYLQANGAEYPNGQAGQHLKQVAQLIKSGVGLEIAFVDVGGWDHHVNEGGVQGQLGNLLGKFGGALAAFHQDLGDQMEDVVVLTMSEFGRTARENGNRGTDHGHANVMFVMGGAVKGGKVYGRWPGLRPDDLNEGRDLKLTTDFRDVFAEAVTRHLGATHTGAMFPGFAVSPDRFRGFLG